MRKICKTPYKQGQLHHRASMLTYSDTRRDIYTFLCIFWTHS